MMFGLRAIGRPTKPDSDRDRSGQGSCASDTSRAKRHTGMTRMHRFIVETASAYVRRARAIGRIVLPQSRARVEILSAVHAIARAGYPSSRCQLMTMPPASSERRRWNSEDSGRMCENLAFTCVSACRPLRSSIKSGTTRLLYYRFVLRRGLRLALRTFLMASASRRIRWARLHVSRSVICDYG